MEILPLLALTILFFLTRAIYRLWFSPLAHVPGPRLAALTSWYCAYHDVIRGGQYIWAIEEMHKRYGPVVRIMPNVVHVNDPSFIDQLYPQSPQLRRERAQTVLNLFLEHLSVLPTRDHNLHRQRRAVLSRFFSQQNVRRLVPVINDTLASLMRRMDGWEKAGAPFSLNAAYRAATKDIIQDYALGEGQKCLDMDDCNAAFFETLKAERMSHVGVHFHWFAAILTKLHPKVILFLSPHILNFMNFVNDIATKIGEIRNSKDFSSGHTIFHEILRSDISTAEKSTPRLVDEAMVLAIAGADTTANTLVALTYHVISTPQIFTRLRAELDTVMPHPDQPPDAKALDGLPFLNALIEETLRLYPSATHRQDRVAPDENLLYTYPSGRTLLLPAGTMIGMTAPLLNRHPAWYEDPEKFDPERYLRNSKLMRKHLTFSKGMRQCLGMNLAYQELQTFTAGIFRKYRPFESESASEGDGSDRGQKGGSQTSPTLELFETDIDDVKTYADYVTPGLRPGSKGVQIRIRGGY